VPERVSQDYRRRLAISLVLVFVIVVGTGAVSAVVGSHHKHPHHHVHLVPLILAVSIPLVVIVALVIVMIRKRAVLFQPSPLLAIDGSRNRRQVWRAAMKGRPVTEEHREAVRSTAERTHKMRWLVWIYVGNAVLQLALVPTSHAGTRLFHTALGGGFLVIAAAWWRMAQRARALAARLAPEPTTSAKQLP
jgi:hypothetical protein